MLLRGKDLNSRQAYFVRFFLSNKWSYLKRSICLANASLDIAFHDTVSIDFYSTVALLLAARPEKNEDSKESDEYIKMFWVGLMDGDGSIQVNH